MQVQLDNVVVTRSGAAVLSGITLTIRENTTVAVLGRSGCGKTTLVQVINGMLVPTAGTVTIDDAPFDYASPERLRRQMGYVMQEPGLFPHLTVAQNIGLLPKLESWPAERISGRVGELLRLVSLPAGILDVFPTRISGGQRQRVAFARALVLDPPLLLLDEPFSALDPVVRQELHDEFLRWRRELRCAALLVTHDFAEAYRLANRILLLDGGIVVQDATPAEFVAHPQTPLAAAFVASARGLGR